MKVPLVGSDWVYGTILSLDTRWWSSIHGRYPFAASHTCSMFPQRSSWLAKYIRYLGSIIDRRYVSTYIVIMTPSADTRGIELLFCRHEEMPYNIVSNSSMISRIHRPMSGLWFYNVIAISMGRIYSCFYLETGSLTQLLYMYSQLFQLFKQLCCYLDVSNPIHLIVIGIC